MIRRVVINHIPELINNTPFLPLLAEVSTDNLSELLSH
jgi:hypothetical protein